MLRPLCALLVCTAIFTSCERSIDVKTRTVTVSQSAANEAASNKCRLVAADNWNGFTTETYHYNAEGLVSDCQVNLLGSLFMHATMQYDNKGKLITGTLSYDNITVYDVVFEYENDRIVKEVIYEPGTSIIADYTVSTYNQKGQIVKRESPPFNLYATFTYDAVGNVITDDVYLIDNDHFYFGIAFQYNMPFKEPKSARPGMPPFSWWWLDELTSPFLPNGRDEFAGDDFGERFQIYDEDPSLTVINSAAQNLAADRLSIDNFFGGQFYSSWLYENCGGKNTLNKPASTPAINLDQHTKDKIFLKMPLLKGPGLKKQLAERKAIYRRLRD